MADLVGWVDLPPAGGHLLVGSGGAPVPVGRGRSWLDAGREELEAFLGELLRCRALETVASGYRQLRILDGWLEDEEIAARQIGRALIEGSRSGPGGQGLVDSQAGAEGGGQGDQGGQAVGQADKTALHDDLQ
jgi:hypothetical protein